MRVIEWIKSWFGKPAPNKEYLRGFHAGAAFAREHGAFWAHERSIDYDAFDRGWDDGMRFALGANDARN